MEVRGSFVSREGSAQLSVFLFFHLAAIDLLFPVNEDMDRVTRMGIMTPTWPAWISVWNLYSADPKRLKIDQSLLNGLALTISIASCRMLALSLAAL